MASPAVLWALSMAGTATSIIQNTSGFPLLRRIREDGDAAAYSRAPTLIMTVTTLQIGLYGIFLYGYPDGLQLVFGNVVGFCTWLITFSVMLHYTHGVRARRRLRVPSSFKPSFSPSAQLLYVVIERVSSGEPSGPVA